MIIIRIITYTMIWVLWMIMGLVFWIPLLVRATASVAAGILYCAITESDPSSMKASFETALTFYPRGFELIARVLSTNYKGQPIQSKTAGGSVWWRVVLEMCWTALFWGSLILGVSGMLGYRLLPAITSLGELPSASAIENAVNSWREGKTFYEQGKYDLALAQLDKSINLYPTYEEAYIYRGVIYSEKKSYDLALAAFTKAIELQPHHLRNYLNRGYTYFSKGNFDAAVDDNSHATRLDPTCAEAYCSRGYAFMSKGMKELAVKDFRRVIELNNNPDSTKKADEQLKQLGVQ